MSITLPLLAPVTLRVPGLKRSVLRLWLNPAIHAQIAGGLDGETELPASLTL